jgi:uncharacterized protein (DUF2062 family)
MVRKAVRHILALDDSPERIALAFAIGIFLAFSPLLGLHTFLGLTIAFLLRLNRPAVLMGVFVNNPWTLVPIYTLGSYVGGWLVGFPATDGLPHFTWGQLMRGSYWVEMAGHWRVLKPMFLGSTILALLAAAISYPLAVFLIAKGRAYRAHRERVML